MSRSHRPSLRWLALFLLTLNFFALLLTSSSYAYPFFRIARDGNPSAFPQGYSSENDFNGPQGSPVSCTRLEGRQFTFNYSFVFNLEGISLYVLTPEANRANFDLSLFSLSLFEGQSPTFKASTPLAFRVRPTFKNIVAFDGQSNPTFEVFFPFEPVYLETSKTYTFILECSTDAAGLYRLWDSPQISVGPAQYFDATTLTARPYYAANYKIQFSIFSKSGHAQNRPIRVSPTAPSRRPIILVHGLGGLPGDFNDLVDSLAAANWSRDYLLPFDYGLKTDGGYNNFTDLFSLDSRLNLAVANLSARFRADGGDGKVDLVSYSSGGLIARHYLARHTGDHQVRRFVSLAAPFKGSFLADLDSGSSDFTGSETKLPLRLAKLVGPSLSDLKPLTFGRDPSETNFRSQIKSGSDKVSADQKEDLPGDVAYYNLQGEIATQLTQKIFQSAIKVVGSLGDGAVLGESAADLPRVVSTSFPETLNLSRLMSRGALSAVNNLAGLDLSRLKFLHQNLLKAAEVKARILEILKE